MPLPIAALQSVPLREAFPSEPHAFTAWLADNLDALGQRLGLTLTLVQREKDVGSFRLDLLCEDGLGRPVIIENQLEPTDHRHLGQVLTYLVNLEAKTAVWVTSEPRPEHQRVIDWLNEATPADVAFYLVRVEAVRIGDSPAAPLFTVLVRPDAQSKEIGEQKKEMAGRHHSRLDFWTGLLEKARPRLPQFARRSATKAYWVDAGTGWSGLTYSFLILQGSAGIQLYIDFDRETGARNKQLFDLLYAQRDALEAEVGGPMEWARLDDKRASRITWFTYEGSLTAPDTWDALQDQLVETMARFIAAFDPRLKTAMPTLRAS